MTLIVHTLSSYPENEPNIKMEVGIEDCLHIEFEYNKSKYDLNDVIVGKIYFLLVRIKIKNMEISIMRRESVGTGPSLFHETDSVGKFEVLFNNYQLIYQTFRLWTVHLLKENPFLFDFF